MPDQMQDIYDALVQRGKIAFDPAQKAAIADFEILRAHFEETPTRPRWNPFARRTESTKGVYLWGGVGRGKSMLMDLFAERAPVEAKRRVHFHAFMQEIHAGMNAARARGADDAIKPVAETLAGELRLLCLDEMQIADIADAMIVGRLFGQILDAGVIVATTSNRPPEDLYKDGLNRQLFLPFVALLRERMHVRELESPTDYRRHLLEGEPVYFVPADAAARERVEAIWRDLASGGGEPLTLRVKGRDVVLPRFCNGVARAQFWELCGRPLGSADYLAVAEAARVLILEDVPRLSRSNYNEAKRFVVLIDALYEARVRLIVTAADIPERLYVEGEGSFEFDRAASRLREMQAADWGN